MNALKFRMTKLFPLTTLSSIIIVCSSMGYSVSASESSLYIAYPPDNHQTTSDKIFLIGSADPDGSVLVNGQAIARSRGGHFAPSFPLQLGENVFTLRYQDREIQLKITRLSNEPKLPQGVAFVADSLSPGDNIARLPDELICFGAIASPEAKVSVRLSDRIIPLFAQTRTVQLPANSAVLTDTNQTITSTTDTYRGCTKFERVGNLGNPLFQLDFQGQTIAQQGTSQVDILDPNQLEVIEVTAEAGVARTGPSTDYSRLTPLPKGTIASVTGKEGDWLRLDYGGWINRSETRSLGDRVPPQSMIRGINARQVAGATEIIFPLQIPVPISIQQGEKTFTLTLYNTTAQTDTIHLDDDPIIKRLDWQQIAPNQIEYTFHLKSEQQWGYDVKYEGSNLILSLRHPPALSNQSSTPLDGIKILLDPGHGGQELGSKGPTGYPEKDVNLVVSKLLEKALRDRGATVYLTRDDDRDVALGDRVEQINKLKPTLAISIHYNALPDNGDAINTAGVGAFWYYPQAHDLSVFLQKYLVEKLDRPSYGVFWNNLALTRPHAAPSILLELGFMINPDEFEWVTNPEAQKQLAQTLADGITEWFRAQAKP